MFARAAIVGRVARERAEARRNFLQQKAEMKKRIPELPYKQRCFIPLLKGPCLTVGLGCFLILCGAIMCNFAFHAKELAMIKVRETDSPTTSTSEVNINKHTYMALKSLTFIGPSLMGLGIFIIIIACVLLCDKRDKVLKEFADNIIRTQQELSKELSLHAVQSDHMQSKSPMRQLSMSDNESKRCISGSSPSRRTSSKSVSSLNTFHNIMHNITESGKENPEFEQIDEHAASAESILLEDAETSDIERGADQELGLSDNAIASCTMESSLTVTNEVELPGATEPLLPVFGENEDTTTPPSAHPDEPHAITKQESSAIAPRELENGPEDSKS